MTFNIRHAALIVAAAGMLLSVASLPLHTASAQTQEENAEEAFVSDELVQKLETLKELVEQLVLLVEQVRNNSEQGDIGNTVSNTAQGLGDGIVRVFVGDDLSTIRYRENQEEALALCMDSVQLSPRDDGYGMQTAARCTYNGQTIYSGSTQDTSADIYAFEGSRSIGTTETSDNVGGSNLPDLIVSDADYERLTTSMRFNYNIENIRGGSVATDNIGMLLEVDVGCNGGVEYLREFSTGEGDDEGDPLTGGYSFYNETFSDNYLFQNAGGCFGFTVDYVEPRIGEDGPVENNGRILESNEDNNFSGWIDFGNYDSGEQDGEGSAPVNCPDGYYWDDKESICVDTSV